MLVEPAELPSRHPRARIDAGFTDLRRAVYAGGERPWHEVYLDMAADISTRELIAHIERTGPPAPPSRTDRPETRRCCSQPP